jgi:predicted CXXCH cytochrome family protein
MVMRPSLRSSCVAAVDLFLLAAAAPALAQVTPAQTPPAAPPEGVAYCLACHEDKDAALTLEDKTSLSLTVDWAEFTRSVHGKQLVCTDCHAKYDQDHPSGKTFASRRAYTLSAYATCKKCHFDTYTKTLESVHYKLLKAGMDSAPVCSDCHGSHNIQNPHAKRAMLSRSCASCHVATYEKYAKSVHGRALVEDGNLDVPACADCHTHHQIQAPDSAAFKLNVPGVCIKCHGDKALMSKYGISTTVAQTYLSDFHGVTASLTKGASTGQQQMVVTCVNCHGTHDIAAPKLRGAEAMRTTVAAACSSCHQGASPGFPAAWLSHYEPSLRHAPMVYVVDLFYKFFIPFMVFGLVLQVLLHVYRMSAGR